MNKRAKNSINKRSRIKVITDNINSIKVRGIYSDQYKQIQQYFNKVDRKLKPNVKDSECSQAENQYYLVQQISLLMSLISQLREFYCQFDLKQGFDNRSEQQKQKQKTVVSKICNQQIFHIKLTPKKTTKYASKKLQRIELGDGQFCFITDNRVKSEQSIIAIHGAPGNYSQWAGLETEMEGKYRWINFTIPGLDGQDERRGTYKGDRKSLNDMFIRLVNKLKLKRVIIIGHSFGGSVGFSIASQYPRLIQGYINVGGLTKFLQLGQTLVCKSAVFDYGYQKRQWKQKRLFDIDQQRKAIYKKYASAFKEGTIQLFKEYEYFGFLKLSLQSPEDLDNISQNYNVYFPKLRVNLYGRDDPLVSLQTVEATIFQLVFDQSSYANTPAFRNMLKIAKQSLEQRVYSQFGIKIEGQKIQEYLNFIFDLTGHNVHKRCPEQLSKIIKIYMLCLQIIYEKSTITKSNL